MNDLNDLLERAAGPHEPHSPVDARADLTRGHHALARTRVRRGAAGLVGVAAVGVLGVGLTRGGDDATPVATDPTSTPSGSPTSEPTTSPTPEPTTAPSSEPTTAPTTAPTLDPSAPVTGSAAPSFFDVPAAPPGWELQGNSPSSVIYARPGATSVPEDFRGKLALTFSANPHSGAERVVDGRTYWVIPDSGDGYARVTVKTGAGQPAGNLELQFPGARWSVEEAITFLAGVRVLDGAVAVAG